MNTKEGLDRLLRIRTKRYQNDYNNFINAAMMKEESWQKMHETRKELESLNRTEFETSQAASSKAALPKGGLALSIEKVFGTQGLELVQRALREESPGRVQHFKEPEQEERE